MFDTLYQNLAHLPVTEIAETVAEYFATQQIPVVTAKVASGKTMLIPAYCAQKLSDEEDNIVIVLEPTRFLSNNAAESLRSILGPEHENLVGCINSNRSDEQTVRHHDNRIIFTTYGYALSSGLLSEYTNFILDEAHDTGMDLSLTKAFLNHRRQLGDMINIAVLSATIDKDNELAFWGVDAEHFTAEGSAFPVEYLHRPAFSIGESVLSLVEEYDRKGVMVFVSGTEEISDAIEDIKKWMDLNTQINRDYEIESVHGNSSGDERRKASRSPTKPIKILVGTNVMESGVSLSWVDGGVSSGDTKVMHVEGNMRKLIKEELPAWRIKQQEGRVCRFKDGVFILAHPTPIEHRPNMASPDIVRLPLTELVMQCTNFPDIRLRDLKFTPREQPKPKAISDAIAVLVRYGLVEDRDDGLVRLTDDGKLIQPLPLSFRAASAVCEAIKVSALDVMLPLIAIIDIGDMRHDYRQPMRTLRVTSSDYLNQLITITYAFYNYKSMTSREMKDTAEIYNISIKKFREFVLLISDLEVKTNICSHFLPYTIKTPEPQWKDFEKIAKQVIFRAMMQDSYEYDALMKTVSFETVYHNSIPFSSAQLSKSTTVSIGYRDEVFVCSGNTRMITPKESFPFAVVEMITAYDTDDLKRLLTRFGRQSLERLVRRKSLQHSGLNGWLLGGSREIPQSRLIPNAVEESNEPKTGTLGDILGAVLAKKLNS